MHHAAFPLPSSKRLKHVNVSPDCPPTSREPLLCSKLQPDAPPLAHYQVIPIPWNTDQSDPGGANPPTSRCHHAANDPISPISLSFWNNEKTNLPATSPDFPNPNTLRKAGITNFQSTASARQPRRAVFGSMVLADVFGGGELLTKWCNKEVGLRERRENDLAL